MRGQPIVHETLARLGIAYEAIEHEPAYTVEDMETLPIPAGVTVAKNLFLRDAKGRRHFLVVLQKDKTADLRGLEAKIGSSRLSFASADRLSRHLGLTRGSVTPLGVLNDEARAVEVVFDSDLERCGKIGVHPNDNTATLMLEFADLLRVVKEHGNPVCFV